MAENDEKDMLDEKGAGEGKEARVEVKPEEKDAVTKSYPVNKYELAIVAAREARRLNENWKDPEERQSGRITEKALDRARKGDVHFTLPDDQGR